MLNKSPLNSDNISFYINGNIIAVYTIQNIEPLLQNDYGGLNDCTLTSITTVIKWLIPSLNTEYVYNQVEKIAKKFLYTGGYGTLSLTIGKIYQKALLFFNRNLKVKTKYLKNIGFHAQDIIDSLRAGKPVLLNIWKDGRDFYKNHSVLVIGYIETTEGLLLTIYDNWSKEKRYIDYYKMSMISSINILN